MKKRKVRTFAYILALAIFLVPVSIHAEDGFSTEDDGEMILPDTDLVDIPTAGIIDYYGLQVKTRFYSEGGVLLNLTFGISRLNLGVSASADNFIGIEERVTTSRPEIQAKYRFYDGGAIIPAFALGYDSQGTYYNRDTRRYRQKARGLYLVGSQQLFIPQIQFHPGVNISEFEGDKIFGFGGLNIIINNIVSLMCEWDHIQRVDESRFNAGIRLYATPFFHVDFAVREIGVDTVFDDRTSHKPERIIQLRYHTTF